MDTINTYRTYVQDIITEYSQYKPIHQDVEREAIFDTTHDHYQLMSVGWNNYQRIHATLLHVDIRHGKSGFSMMEPRKVLRIG